ncbi:ABC transporter ATP-binding protein [Brevibacillus laterosporus]|uniref:ABC transporter ATP-binding protein n=1 Tax=Brevibacillus laterosporus TaxID=1465 RepID=UPI000CE521C2|nr:ABC transporter ATP-binding protein [Brevibacillus laterosporus]PPA81226.1 ABC transporter ATP-binding protein [Brevibacillus laterosporus]
MLVTPFKETSNKLETIRNVFASFSQWPSIFRLLYQTHPRYFAIVMILTIISSLIPVGVILATQSLINSAVVVSIGGEMYPLIIAFGSFAFLAVIRDIIKYVDLVYKTLYQELLSNHVNMLIMKKATRLPYSSFEDAAIYDQMQRAKQDSTYRPYQLFQQVMNVISSVITLLSVSAVLITWKWWLALILLLLPICSTFSFIKLGQEEFMIDHNRASDRRKQYYLMNLLTNDSSVKEIKIFQLGKFLVNRYSKYYEQFFNQDKAIVIKRTKVALGYQVITLIAVVSMQSYVVWEMMLGTIAVGSLLAFIQAISYTQSTSTDLMQTIFNMYQNNLYISQLFNFLGVPEEKQKNTEESLSSEKIPSGLEFRNVSFKYKGVVSYALRNVSFTIRSGETLALVGENGSGKSTIVKLITQLYQPTEGEILFDGIPIHHYKENEWRQKISALFQDFIKYEMQVKENIGLGNYLKADDEVAIVEASKLAGADEMIKRFPQQLNTQLGKLFMDGYQISGGQWQRIAISRAYMRDADLYILDEPTAALDPQAEQEVFTRFRELSKNKMGLFISHRFSTVRYANQILVLKQGEIIESGTHKDLIAENGVYASLFHMQASFYLEETDESAKKMVGQV